MGLGGNLGLTRFHAMQVNPFKDEIISSLNLLTDTSDTDYNGVTPSLQEIETYADNINAEII